MADAQATEDTGGGESATSYEQAAGRLDEIIGRLDSGKAELRETLELCAEAKGLIEYCAGELAAVDQGLKELRLDELAASLGDNSSPDADSPPQPRAPEPSPRPDAESGPDPSGDVPF